MKLVFSCLLLCFIVSNQFAQDSVPSNVYKSKIEVRGNYSINSTALTKSFYQSFYNGNFIDASVKDPVKERLLNNNLLGAEADVRAIYYSKPVFKSWGIYAGVSYNEDLGTQFTGDLFNLIFYGNKEFESKTADFSNVQVKYMSSQSVNFGVHRQLSTDSLTKFRSIQFGLNVVKGQNLYDIKIDKGNIFTAENGEYIDIAMKGNMHQSDSAKFGFDAVNGVGVGLNFAYKVEKINGIQFLLEATNVGVIQWNKNTTRNYVDTSYHFEGFEIANIFAIQDSTFSNINVDSLSENLKSEKKSQVMLLPLTLHAKYLYPLNGKSYLAADLNYKHWATYIPKLILSYGYKFSTCFTAEITGGYGGYGQLHAGLNARFDCDELQVRLGVSDMLGYIVSSAFSNQGAFLMASYSF